MSKRDQGVEPAIGGAGLRAQIRQSKPFASPAEETYLNLQRTAGRLLQGLTQLLRKQAPGRSGVSPSQYNVLRILRGAYPDSLTCGDIGLRLVTPGPDVTRLLDRLEAKGWVERDRDAGDRRVVRSRITASGLEVVAELDEPVRRWLEHALGHLDCAEHRQMVRLLEAGRAKLE